MLGFIEGRTPNRSLQPGTGGLAYHVRQRLRHPLYGPRLRRRRVGAATPDVALAAAFVHLTSARRGGQSHDANEETVMPSYLMLQAVGQTVGEAAGDRADKAAD